jgi:hypothetical protein
MGKPGTCRHGLVVCSRCVIVTDAARRMSDQINARLVFTPHWEIHNCYMAFKLADGDTDGVLYESKQDAIRHCPDERWYAFFCFRSAMGGVNPKDCQIFLDVHRHAYSVPGGHLSDPDGRPDLIISDYGYNVLSKRVNPRGT